MNDINSIEVLTCCVCDKSIKLKDDHIEVSFIDYYSSVACKKHLNLFKYNFINTNINDRKFDSYIVNRRMRNFKRLLRSMKKANKYYE